MPNFFLYNNTLRLDKRKGPLAQLVEQRTLNPEVEGSSPSWPTKALVKGVFENCMTL